MNTCGGFLCHAEALKKHIKKTKRNADKDAHGLNINSAALDESCEPAFPYPTFFLAALFEVAVRLNGSYLDVFGRTKIETLDLE